VDSPEALPRVEELTPESDLSSFLREGVPEALKKAALRRMWSLDPAIRDFVGPAEYAWDFNNPGAIPGFGAALPPTFRERVGEEDALSPSGEAPHRLAARAPEPPSTPGERAAPERLGEAQSPAQRGADVPVPGGTSGDASSTPEASAFDPSPQGEGEASNEAAEDGSNRAGPRHGGALPR
jgi:hypothetical protein